MSSSVVRDHLPKLFVVLALLAALGPMPSAGGAEPGSRPENPVVVLFPAHRIHVEAASALHRDLSSAGYEVLSLELPSEVDDPWRERVLRQLADAGPKVVATAGTKATALALERLPHTPVVFFMVPNALDAPFMAKDSPDRRRVAGVTTDIAPRIQIEWLTALCPEAKTVGILMSARSKYTAARIKAAAAKRQMGVTLIESAKDDFLPAIDALNAHDCDAVLMIPDARVYNSVSVQRLLLWGIRQQKPVSAFSAQVVKAGALTGQYCDNQAVGRQAARLIRRVLEGADLASIGLQYPDQVHHAVNRRTADLIGITLDQRELGSKTVWYGSK